MNIRDKRFNDKLAAVDAAYQNDELRDYLFDCALDFLKESGAVEKLASAENFLEAAVDLTETLADHFEKTASDDSDDSDDSDIDWDQVFEEAAPLLKEAGITSEDIQDIDNEEDSYKLGVLALRLLVAQEEGLLGDE